MYIPLEYWRRLESAPAIEGARDGRAVTFGNVGRYLTNTSFAQLVAEGWVGTTVPQTALLEPVIRDILETGRTVTIAVKRDLTREEIADRLEDASDGDVLRDLL